MCTLYSFLPKVFFWVHSFLMCTFYSFLRDVFFVYSFMRFLFWFMPSWCVLFTHFYVFLPDVILYLFIPDVYICFNPLLSDFCSSMQWYAVIFALLKTQYYCSRAREIHTHTHTHTVTHCPLYLPTGLLPIIYVHMYICIYIYVYIHICISTTLSTENATSPQSTKSRNSDSPVSRGTNSNRDVGWIWICTEKFEFLDSVDFGGVAFSEETVMCVSRWLGLVGSKDARARYIHTHTHTHTATRCTIDLHTGLLPYLSRHDSRVVLAQVTRARDTHTNTHTATHCPIYLHTGLWHYLFRHDSRI